jgi:hypothetical protein
LSVLPEWVGVSVGTIDVIGYGPAMNDQSPIVSEFASPEEAAAYENWLREKVARSLADPRPSVPHDEVMAEMRAIVERKGKPGKAC